MTLDPTDPLFSSNFSMLLARAARDHGDGVAIQYKGKATTFRALAARAGGIAAGLRAAGVRSGDRCAVLIREPSDAAAAFFAVLATGAVGLNVNELYRPRQLEYVLQHSGASTFLHFRRPHRFDGERRGDRTVHAAAHAHDVALALERRGELGAKNLNNA